MIKKSVFIMFSLVAMLFICSCSRPAYTKEKWVYSDVLSINVNEDIDESLLQAYLENKGVTSVSELETVLLKEAKEEKTFSDFYLFFDDKYAYYHDENLDRETTFFYKEINGEVVLAIGSIQLEEPYDEVNLDPIICPRAVVSEDGKELTFTYYCYYYFVSIKCVIENK